MQTLHNTPKRSICASSAVCFLLFASTLKSPGQGSAAGPPGDTAAPDIHSILQKLDASLEAYLGTIPSFYCDEHAVAGVVQGTQKGTHSKLTEADSTFELMRVSGPSGKTILSESREVKSINGHPSPGSDFRIAGMPQGAFSGSLSLVSLRQQACMQYSLLPGTPQHPDSYTIQFTSLADRPPRAGCLLPEEATGRVIIDRASLEVTRIEFTAPHHPIAWAGNLPVVRGMWRVFVDYAPVQLDGRIFWLPSRINSEETDGVATWRFDGAYRDYHKLEVWCFRQHRDSYA